MWGKFKFLNFITASGSSQLGLHWYLPGWEEQECLFTASCVMFIASWGVALLFQGGGESPNLPLRLFWHHPGGRLLPGERGTPSSPPGLGGPWRWREACCQPAYESLVLHLAFSQDRSECLCMQGCVCVCMHRWVCNKLWKVIRD